MKTEEQLRKMMIDYARSEKTGAAENNHLRDEDFIRLIEAESPEENASTETNNNSNSIIDELALLRVHLATCDYCLAQFKDFYAFFAPAGKGEIIAGKSEIDTAWQAFAPRISNKKEEAPQKEKISFWAWLFPAERNPGYLAAFGWSLAALLLVSTAISIFVAIQARDEKAQIAAQLENQKQTSEERLKTLEQSSQNRDLAEQEKTRLAEEKGELQKQIAQLQTDIERAKQETKTERERPSVSPTAQTTPDNSLVAVNTPIYDVFPADAVVRGNGQSGNKFAVPNAARNVVLILNAAGQADFSTYQAELINNAGKTIWRGAGLRKDNLGNFTLTLIRSALKPGNYKLRLFGKNGATTKTVAEYPITIEIGK